MNHLKVAQFGFAIIRSEISLCVVVLLWFGSFCNNTKATENNPIRLLWRIPGWLTCWQQKRSNHFLNEKMSYHEQRNCILLLMPQWDSGIDTYNYINRLIQFDLEIYVFTKDIHLNINSHCSCFMNVAECDPSEQQHNHEERNTNQNSNYYNGNNNL